jgi:hypothetical protein
MDETADETADGTADGTAIDGTAIGGGAIDGNSRARALGSSMFDPCGAFGGGAGTV